MGVSPTAVKESSAGGAEIGAVVFFGPPGAGKGTQARTLAVRWGVPAISTGDMIRDLSASDTPSGRKARGIMEQGDLIPDQWMNQLVEKRLREPDCRRGFVLDGYPRTPAQAEALLASNGARIKVIHFRIQPDEVVRRITGRRVCPKCGTIYNLHGRAPRDPARCDLDQTLLVTRADDREEVIRARLRQYEQPVLQFFCSRGLAVFEVDASKSVPEVADELSRLIR
jgi:adenylate kinase